MDRKTTWTGVLAAVMFGASAVAQDKPLPKPVSPPLPVAGSASPATPGNAPAGAPEGNLPQGRESAVATFIDKQTLAVARVDLQGVDLKALQDWVEQGVEDLRKNDKEVGRAQGDVRHELGNAAAWVERFRAAGANQLYVVVSFEDMTADRPPFLVIPLQGNADPHAIEGIFNGSGAAAAGPDQITAREVGRAVVVAVPATFDRLKTATAAARPDLTRAFEAAGEGQLHLAVIPQEDARKTFESLAPNLPDELGGGQIQIVSRGMQWASLGIALPPNPSLRLLLQASDADAARKLDDVANKAVAWAGDRKQGPREALAFTKLVSQLKPRVEGDRLTVELKESELRQLAATFAAGLLNARVAAQRTQSASNLRQLDMAVIMYANDHKGELPKDLGEEINSYLAGGAKQVWNDPLRPNQKKPYVYVRVADRVQQVQNAAEAVMIYENHTTWDNGVNVAFADGHVEWVADEKKFKQLLEDTKKANPAAAEMPQ